MIHHIQSVDWMLSSGQIFRFFNSVIAFSHTSSLLLDASTIMHSGFSMFLYALVTL